MQFNTNLLQSSQITTCCDSTALRDVTKRRGPCDSRVIRQWADFGATFSHSRVVHAWETAHSLVSFPSCTNPIKYVKTICLQHRGLQLLWRKWSRSRMKFHLNQHNGYYITNTKSNFENSIFEFQKYFSALKRYWNHDKKTMTVLFVILSGQTSYSCQMYSWFTQQYPN